MLLLDIVLWLSIHGVINYFIHRHENRGFHKEWEKAYGEDSWYANIPHEKLQHKMDTYGTMGLPADKMTENAVDFIPDGMVVCHTEIIGEHTVNGPPDLVIEILSRSTWQIDRGHKKDAYEAAGVREYWIVDPVNMILEQYVLSGSRYALVCVAAYVPERQMEGLDERERAALCSEFPCGILPGLTIRLKDVFNRVTLPRQ